MGTHALSFVLLSLGSVPSTRHHVLIVLVQHLVISLLCMSLPRPLDLGKWILVVGLRLNTGGAS